MANLSLQAAQIALEDLRDRALVVADTQFQTFLLPPLAVTFLHRKRPEIIAQTGERLTDYVFALVLENGYHRYERFPLLDVEWAAITASLPLFLKGDISHLQRLCHNLDNFLSFSGRWDERLALCLQAEERANAAGDTYHAGWLAYNAGTVYSRRGQASELLTCARRVEAYWSSGSAREQAYVMQLHGLWYELEKDYPAAVVAFREMVSMLRTVAPESTNVATALNNLASAESAIGNYEAAERDNREALRIARKIDDRRGVA
jgi:tetratricopeptide (TPR) repeat protein